MPRYAFIGNLTKCGVVFYITADTKAEACELAAQGQYHEVDALGAETSDWEIWLDTCEEE